MEQERIESIEVELELAVENFESSLDDIKAQRFRRATSGFYFTLEHLAKALLLTVGVEVESHGAVARMLGLHFVKSASLNETGLIGGQKEISVGNVLSIKISLSTEIPDGGFTGFLINITDNHPGAFFYKTPGRCAADAGGL